MLDTFSFGVSSNLSQQKSPTAEIIGMYFLGTIVLRKYMPIISAVGLFCYDKFEETPNKKVVNMSKLTKSYFKVSFSYLWQLLTFSFGVSSNFSQQKSPTAKIIGLYFLGTIVPRKYMPTISAVGLFSCNKFEETPNEKVGNCQR